MGISNIQSYRIKVTAWWWVVLLVFGALGVWVPFHYFGEGSYAYWGMWLLVLWPLFVVLLMSNFTELDERVCSRIGAKRYDRMFLGSVILTGIVLIVISVNHTRIASIKELMAYKPSMYGTHSIDYEAIKRELVYGVNDVICAQMRSRGHIERINSQFTDREIECDYFSDEESANDLVYWYDSKVEGPYSLGEKIAKKLKEFKENKPITYEDYIYYLIPKYYPDIRIVSVDIKRWIDHEKQDIEDTRSIYI